MIWETSKLSGLNITECLPSSKRHHGESVLVGDAGSRPKRGRGKADEIEEETGKWTRWDGRDEDQASGERLTEITSGTSGWQQGLSGNLQRLLDRGKKPQDRRGN